ncbi:MAG: peptidyl-prolyl cis-trans isomerase [Solirubrobacteraceae bacterium]
MKNKRIILALGAFFVLIALAISGCGSSGVPDGAVATVAGNTISKQAFNHWMFVAAKEQASQSPGQPVIVPNDPPKFDKCLTNVRAEIPALKKTADKQLRADCKQLFTSLSSQVMDFLVKAYWYQADAHTMGIKVTDAQVQTALAAAKKGQFSTATQFNSFLSSTGQTLQDVTYRVRVQQIYTKLLAKHPTTVTPAQISAFYQSHLSQFGTPELRNMKIVLTKTQAQAVKAQKALKSGTSWAKVAKQYSIDPTTKNKGGVLMNVSKGQQDAALSAAAFSAAPNKLLGPVKGQFGYYLLEVTKVIPAKTRTLAQSTTLIRQQITSQMQTAAQTAVNAQAKKAWLAKTQCNSLYAMADCKGYKAPPASAGGAAGAAGAAGSAGAAGAAGSAGAAGAAGAAGSAGAAGAAGSAAPGAAAPAGTGTTPAG